MFNGQMLFDRMMSVRMDKLADQPNQQMPAKLPSKFIIPNVIVLSPKPWESTEIEMWV